MCIQMGGTRDHHHATALCGDTEPLNSTDWSHEEGRHKDNSEERGAGEGGKGDFRVRNNLLPDKTGSFVEMRMDLETSNRVK